MFPDLPMFVHRLERTVGDVAERHIFESLGCEDQCMSRRKPLGRLVIAFGPETHNHDKQMDYDVFRTEPYDHISGFLGLIDLMDDQADPFTATWFGKVVKALLTGSTVVLTDPAFDDPKYRRRWEQAFRRTFPDLTIDQVPYGDVPSMSGADDTDLEIVIDDDVYEEGDMGSNERIVVESDAPTSAVVTALTSAADRMMSVGEDGQEYPDGRTPGGIYTPNYSSEVTLDENGNPGFYIDCKSAIEPPMAVRFRQVLVEELRKAGVTSARVRVPD